MKKNLFKIFTGAIALSTLTLVSCDKETDVNTVVVDTPVLTVTSPLEINAEGGSYTIAYNVSNYDGQGTVACKGDVSWISNIDTSIPGAISFSVAENTLVDLRTGNISLTYTYSAGDASDYVLERAAVIQYGVGDASLTVNPNSITAAYEGGTYSFGFEVDNVTGSGSIDCQSDADWIESFDYSDFGTVSFTVDENDLKEFRTATITVTYSYGYDDAITREVTVIQDHPDVFGRGDANEVIGTYIASGTVYGSGYSDEEAEWTLRIFKYSGSSGYDIFIEGILPWSANHYASTGDHDYATYGYYRYGEIMIPSQCSSTTIVTATVSGQSVDFYLGYLSCTGTSDGYYYYSSDLPDCIFHGDPETGEWLSYYGIFAAACEVAGQIESLYANFQASAPYVYITKISSDPEYEVPDSSAESVCVESLGAAENAQTFRGIKAE